MQVFTFIYGQVWWHLALRTARSTKKVAGQTRAVKHKIWGWGGGTSGPLELD